MTNAWYQVLSLSFGYLSAAMAVVCVLLTLRKYLRDRRILRRVRRATPRVGSAGTLRVASPRASTCGSMRRSTLRLLGAASSHTSAS